MSKQHFNTSHVSINRKNCKGKRRYCRISIHLMFLLIAVYQQRRYSKCKISIHLMFLLIALLHHLLHHLADFNTSHVSINLDWVSNPRWISAISIHLMFLLIAFAYIGFLDFYHFNTSHVSINLLRGFFLQGMFPNFNTSHVSINRFFIGLFFAALMISIHLMFLLIKGQNGIPCYINFISIHLMFLLIRVIIYQQITIDYFNTSHVSINLK